MKIFGSYFILQLRRTLRYLPALVVLTLVLCGCAGIFALQCVKDREASEDRKKYRIALVGETDDTYLGFGISVLSRLDDSRYMLDFPSMTEAEARRALMAGEIDAYAKVPEGLTDSVVRGTNDTKVTLVGSTNQKGMAGILVEELAEAASTMIVRSQSAVFGMQNILWENDLGDQWREYTEKLNLRLIDMVLNRTGLCDLKVLGIAGGLSTEGHYLCGITVFFLLLAGIGSSPLFSGRNRELAGLMASRGVGPIWQVAGEYLAYLLPVTICLFGIFLTVWPLWGSGSLEIEEWSDKGILNAAGFFFTLFPVVAAFAAMQFFVYEAAEGVVSGILLQFVGGIGMAYIAGCFYPAGMFPDRLRQVGEVLPAGVALRYAGGSLTGAISFSAAAGLLLYLILFLALSVLVRRRRIQRG